MTSVTIKGLAISFATGTSRYRLTITNRPSEEGLSYSLSIAWNDYNTFAFTCQSGFLLSSRIVPDFFVFFRFDYPPPPHLYIPLGLAVCGINRQYQHQSHHFICRISNIYHISVSPVENLFRYMHDRNPASISIVLPSHHIALYFPSIVIHYVFGP